MDGDLSLSQSFGGLRIANPDDTPTTNPNELETQTDNNGGSNYNYNPGPYDPSGLSRPEQHSISKDSPYPRSVSPSSILPAQPHTPNRLSQSSYGHLDQQAYPTSRLPPNLPHGLDSTSGHPVRPSSTYFPPDPSSNPAARTGSYRARTKSGASAHSENYIRSSDSRAAAAALQPRLSVREPNRNHHMQGHGHGHGHGHPPMQGAMPSRRTSRAVQSTGVSPLSGSPYDNGPLQTSDEWQDRGAAVSVRQEVDASGKTVQRFIKKGVRDFSFGRTLGEGSYSTVVAATDRQTLKEYAIKMLDKRHIIKEKKVKYVNIEKDTLNRLTDHPGVVRLYYTFQDERSLFFVLDLASGGELLGVLKRLGTFDEECTRFYGAQILDTVDYMHRRGVIHRDLKPENVLLDSHMHVKITDFGTAKILGSPKRPDDNGGGMPPMGDAGHDRASSFVGTAEYVSPELLTDKNACKASDLWAFGCIIFQLLSGRPPFKAGNEYQTFQKIVALDYEFPRGFPPVARDLVERLLVLDPASRLQIEHIKNHEFFDGVTWGRGLWSQKAPRLKPYESPRPEPIKLNGGNNSNDSYPPNIINPNNNPNMSMPPTSNNTGAARPYPRIITDLPPPSQLDIEWSPVLTKSNERILKLGNLTVSSTSLPGGGHGEHEAPKKLSRFFGGATAKRRPRLVLVTSSGRIIVVAAGGDDKKPKLDVSLLAPEVQYRSTTDMKGHSSWIVDTRDKRYIFEETKPASDGTAAVTVQEWVDALDRAKETAQFHATPSTALAEDSFRDMQSNHGGGESDDASMHLNIPSGGGGRAALVKNQARGGGDDSESVKGRKRFSRRQSKNGLSAIF